MYGGRTVWSHIGSDRRADSKPGNLKLLKPKAEWRQQDVRGKEKKPIGEGEKDIRNELGMRRSGSLILEKYRRTKRKKMLVQAKKPGRGRQPMILLCPGSWASSVGGTDNKKGQEEPGPPESVLMSNPSFHVCGNEGPVGKPRPWLTGVWG